MNTAFDNLPEPLQQQANEVCNKFEAAWQRDPRPNIRDFLDQAPEVDRQTLLGLLIPLDIDYRRLAGEHPTETEYCEAFLGDVPTIRQIFAADVPESSRSFHAAHPSVLEALGQTLDGVPQVVLRDPAADHGPIVRPASLQAS